MRHYHIGAQNRALLAQYLDSGKNRSLHVQIPDLLGGEKCVNCSDVGGISFVVKERKGLHSYPINRFYFHCPECTNHDSLIAGMLDKTGIDQDDRHYHVDYIRDHQDKQLQYQWAVNQISQGGSANGFVLWRGDYGVGKTGLAKAIVLQMAQIPVYAHYTTGEFIIVDARSTFSDGSTVSEADVIRDFCQYKILVVDEVDIVGSTDYSIATLRTILNLRYEARGRKLTIMITNRVDNFWPYLFSRLDDGQIIDFAGESLRGLS